MQLEENWHVNAPWAQLVVILRDLCNDHLNSMVKKVSIIT